jgi:hypothetical protein
MAASVLAYLGACDVVRMLTHQELVGAPPAYLLVPTVSEAELAAAAMPNGNGRNGHKPQPVANGTAVSDPTKPAANGNGRANAQPSVDLMYGDGTAVDATNQTEIQTYRRHLTEKQMPPQSKEALLAYYRELMA